jgi:peptidoglycan/LPS O-acetylase OafA/YrhL
MKEDFGPMTAVWLEPDWIKLGYYSIFFGYGAICFGHAGFHEKVGRFWPIHFLISIGIFVVALTLLERRDLEWRYELISICSTLFVWLMTFGLIGAFRKFFSGENPRIRYLSDSAYWLYVAHLPLIQVVQLWVAEWPIPSLIKTVFVCVFTTALLLLSYRYLIRYTWVGTMLNGKRTLPSPR